MKKIEACGLPSSSFITIVPAVALYVTLTPLIVTVLVVSESSSFVSFLSGFGSSFAAPLASSFFLASAGFEGSGSSALLKEGTGPPIKIASDRAQYKKARFPLILIGHAS